MPLYCFFIQYSVNIVPHRPPLTAARLAEIWDQHPGPVVLELLREIHRLRATISRADQVRRMIGKNEMVGALRARVASVLGYDVPDVLADRRAASAGRGSMACDAAMQATPNR